jgi:hypothetical protein
MSRKFLALCLLCAGLLACAAPARADQDVVRIFDNINIGPDESVHDAVCIFCGVRVQGKVDGDLVVIFGNLRLSGEAHHDVVTVFSNVSATDSSSIGGDLVSIFGAVRLGNNVSVGKDMVTLFGALRAPSSVSVGKDRVAMSQWVVFGPLLIVFLAIVFIVHEVQTHRRRQFMQNYPPQRQ